MTWAELCQTDSPSPSQIESALRQVPLKVFTFLKGPVMAEVPTSKIQAIKLIRQEYGFGLKKAKEIVDTLCAGTMLQSVDVRTVSPILLDTLQSMEDRCRDAIRQAVGDEKAMTALTGIRQQVADLWLELIELPSPAPSDR